MSEVQGHSGIPAGFLPVERHGPFMGSIGPLWMKREGESLVIGVRIEERHTNLRGIAHGGMLVALADSALGFVLSAALRPPGMVTVSLSTDFLDSARPGDWIEAEVDILRAGRRLVYANCMLRAGERRLLRASGVFALMPKVGAAERSDG